MRNRLAAAFFAVLVLAAAGSAAVQDPPAAVEEDSTVQWMKLNQPGPEHEIFKSLAGDFKAAVKSWTSPKAPEQTSEASTHNELMLGGRFLKGDYTGTVLGRPFKGMVLFGFDNIRQKYLYLWIDELSTTMFLSEGVAEPNGKVINFHGEYEIPGGSKRKFRQVQTLVDDNTVRFEFFDHAANGDEFKSLEIIYTRGK